MRISDWSSDVCSSDLVEHLADPALVSRFVGSDRLGPYHRVDAGGDVAAIVVDVGGVDIATLEALRITRIECVFVVRSEESRVGKEYVSTCRSRLSPYP